MIYPHYSYLIVSGGIEKYSIFLVPRRHHSYSIVPGGF
jgi:hypothetical protein